MSIIKTLRFYGFFKNHLYFYPRFLGTKLAQFLGKRRILLSEVFFESRCNFKCWHCSSSEYTEKKPVFMTLDQIGHVLDELKRMGVISVCYVGGEPTIRKDLDRIIALTHKKKILPSIITNGSLLTEEMVDRLFAAGLANMGFSVQSIEPNVHDTLVNNPGAHTTLMKMLDYSLAKNYTVSVCAVPTNENLLDGTFERLVRFTADRSIRLNVNLPAPVGKLVDDPACILSRQAMNELVSKYFPMDHFLPDFKQTSVGTRVYCPMGEQNVYILPDGEVCPCTFTHISFGNIFEEPLGAIIAKMDSSQRLGSLKREGQCPISMDQEFIREVHQAIRSSDCYPPRGDEIGF